MVPVWMTFSDLWPKFQGHDYSRQITRKCYKIEPYLQWPTNRKSYIWSIERRHFQWSWTTSTPQFQGHAILWRWISQKRYKIHSFNGILIGTYTRYTRECYFEWPWVILGNLAKYSMTWSVALLLLVIIKYQLELLSIIRYSSSELSSHKFWTTVGCC